MAAKMGILGETNTTSSGTYSVYTVPSDKGAHINLLFAFEHAGGVRSTQIQIGGLTPYHYMMSSSGDQFIGIHAGTIASPVSDQLGLYNEGAKLDLDATISGSPLVLPFGDWFLSETDTVKLNMSNQFLDQKFIVGGVEDDV